MPETTKTRVHRNKNGQYQVTIPKALGDAFDLDGSKLDWRVKSGSKMEVHISDQ